jgi:hypothetical protein
MYAVVSSELYKDFVLNVFFGLQLLVFNECRFYPVLTTSTLPLHAKCGQCV